MDEPRLTRVAVDAILDLRARVLHPDERRSAAHISGDRAEGTRHWALWRGDEVIAAVTVTPLRGLALRAMAVDPASQRQGLGLRLLRAVHDEVAAPMWCNSRLAAVPFYAAAGWVTAGPVFLLDGAPHQRMTWAP